MHAPSADLTLLGMAFGHAPAEDLLDAQIVAGLRGPRRRPGAGDPAGAGAGRAPRQGRALHRLEPAAAVAAQLEYAAGDVLHLLELADELERRAEALGRDEWVAEEHERRYGPDARLVPDPEQAWRRVKGTAA